MQSCLSLFFPSSSFRRGVAYQFLFTGERKNSERGKAFIAKRGRAWRADRRSLTTSQWPPCTYVSTIRWLTFAAACTSFPSVSFVRRADAEDIWTRGVVFRNRNGKTLLSNFRVRHPSPPIRAFRPPILQSSFTNNATRRTRHRSIEWWNEFALIAKRAQRVDESETAHVEPAFDRCDHFDPRDVSARQTIGFTFNVPHSRSLSFISRKVVAY